MELSSVVNMITMSNRINNNLTKTYLITVYNMQGCPVSNNLKLNSKRQTK